MDIEVALSEWLADRSGEPIGAEDRFAEVSGLDSFDVLEFVTFCESRFDVRFAAADLQSADFATVRGVARIVARQIAARDHADAAG
jgi:acyl carrier protein